MGTLCFKDLLERERRADNSAGSTEGAKNRANCFGVDGSEGRISRIAKIGKECHNGGVAKSGCRGFGFDLGPFSTYLVSKCTLPSHIVSTSPIALSTPHEALTSPCPPSNSTSSPISSLSPPGLTLAPSSVLRLSGLTVPKTSMSESSLHRRQPPSPLVFSPETVLAPIQSHSHSHSSSGTSNANASASHGSGSNTVSMPFVRRHVTRRLKAAKAECDKELQRVTNSLTIFFEERLREGEHEQESEREQRELGRERDSQLGDPEPLREAFVLQPAELRSALQFDEVSSDGGYEAEPEGSYHSRQRASLDEDRPPQQALTQWSSSPGLLTASVSSTSPASLRRHSTLPRDRPVNNFPASSTGTSSPAASAVMSPTPPPEIISPRKQSNATQSNQWSQQNLANRRLSRTIHIPTRPARSGASSRSTSRSRSPLPRSGYADAGANRRSSRILVDDPVDPIMTTLYEIISVATDVTEMSLNQLTAQPKVCELIVQRVQNIGRAWDEHPDWHGRNWYVQVLLAVASLSRVVEWWEAEKQFWNFDDNDDEQEEPLMFVLKPAEEEQLPAPLLQSESGAVKLSQDDENKLRVTRTTSQGRRSRDEVTKDLSMAPAHNRESEHPRVPSKFTDNTESARVLATERLRLQAETAQNQNIVMELSMDGDHFIWINYAWRNIIGYLAVFMCFVFTLIAAIFFLYSGLTQRAWLAHEYQGCSRLQIGTFYVTLHDV